MSSRDRKCHGRISTDIVRALLRLRLNAAERELLSFLIDAGHATIDDTGGRGLDDLAEVLELRPRRLRATVSKLERRKIVTEARSGSSVAVIKLGWNSDYETWK